VIKCEAQDFHNENDCPVASEEKSHHFNFLKNPHDLKMLLKVKDAKAYTP